MSLPAKGRRTITVDGERYHWAVLSDLRTDTCTVVMVHRALKDPGQKLKITLDGEYIFTPKSVAFAIRDCLERGWRPTKGGTHYVGPQQSKRMVRRFRSAEAAV